MKWLYSLPDEKRQEVERLQNERAMALQLAMGLCVDGKKPVTMETARRIVAKCNRKIEQIAKGAVGA